MYVAIRRKWIENDQTHVSEILEEFPCFMQPQIVCK